MARGQALFNSKAITISGVSGREARARELEGEPMDAFHTGPVV